MTCFVRFSLCLFFLAAVGCQRLPERPVDMPDLVPCIVSVTFDDKKMEGVKIFLYPKNTEADNWPAGGQTDAEGKAILKTAAYYRGVVPGEYVISFQKYAPEEMQPDGMALPAKSLIPLKYSTGKSKETVVVSRDKTEYVFTLESLTNDEQK